MHRLQQHGQRLPQGWVKAEAVVEALVLVEEGKGVGWGKGYGAIDVRVSARVCVCKCARVCGWLHCKVCIAVCEW